MFLLKSIILAGPTKLYRGNLKLMARELWRGVFKDKWTIGRSRTKAWDEISFYNLLVGRNTPPDGDWKYFLETLAGDCARALVQDLAATDILQYARIAALALEDCLDNIFDLAEGYSVRLTPSIDPNLASLPVWQQPDWKGPPPEDSVDAAGKILSLLKAANKRIVYVRGASYSGKREVTRSVIHAMGGKYFMAKNRRLPIFAHAVGNMSATLFIDRVFDFFTSADPFDMVRQHLTWATKLEIIAGVAKREPVLFIVADIELFSQDAVVRRLRGDKIGDVLEAIVNGHPESQILVTISGEEGTLPWQDRAASPVMLNPTREVFLAAIEGLDPSLQMQIVDMKQLTGLTMRLALPIVRHAIKLGQFPVRKREFLDALHRNSEKEILNFTWTKLLSDVDRALLGLIASSHDGLRLTTLDRMVREMRKFGHKGDDGERLGQLPNTPTELHDWALSRDDIVSLRHEAPAARGVGVADTLYIREALRRLVLEVWMTSSKALARSGFWCIARVAADQARTIAMDHGEDAPENTLSLYLQSLHALIASVDPEQIKSYADEAPPPTDEVPASEEWIGTNVLAPLGIGAENRPTATFIYRYAWKQLYMLDVEGETRRLTNIFDDPRARLEALMPFFRPDTPWISANLREFCSAPGDTLTLAELGPAGHALTPGEQVDLLTAVALAALKVGRLHLARDAVQLGRLLRAEYENTLSLRALLRLYRVEIDIGILCGGNPDAKLQNELEFCKRVPRPGQLKPADFNPHDHTLDSLEKRIQELLERNGLQRGSINGKAAAQAAKSGKEDENLRLARDYRFVRGKLYERRGEVAYLQNQREEAMQFFMRTIAEERALAKLALSGDATPTIVGGRGARRIVRFCLWMAVNSNFDRIEFDSDNLHWPTPTKILPDNDWIARANALIDINRTRVTRGYWSDRLGILLDESQVAMTLWDFDHANDLVDMAVKSAERSGADLEILLELGMVRCNIAVESAMRIREPQQGEEKSCQQEKTERLQKLEAALTDFSMLTTHAGLDTYSSLLHLLYAQRDIVSSRWVSPLSPKRVDFLGAAAEKLGIAEIAMNAIGYRTFIPRIAETKAAIAAALHPSDSSISHRNQS